MAGKKIKRKQCTVKGCRRIQKVGEFCAQCAEKNEPANQATKLSELDLLRYLDGDRALENHKLEIRSLDQEQRLEDVGYNQKKRARQHRVNELQAAIKIRMIEQRKMLESLGEKYGFDPRFVSIDDVTGTLHEHKPDEE